MKRESAADYDIKMENVRYLLLSGIMEQEFYL